MLAELPELRANLSEVQRAILDHCWHTYYEGKGNSWPRVQDVQVKFEKPSVLAALDGLPRGAAFAENGQYMLSLLGVLLTSGGELAEDLLVRYLEYLRKKYRASLEQGVVIAAVKSRDVATALLLPDDQLPILASTIHLGRLGGERGAGGGPVWAAGIPGEIADIASAQDLRTYVQERALRQAEELAEARDLPRPRSSAFWFVSDPALRSLLEADHEELARLHNIEASKSSVLLAGGILEGVLLDALSRDEAGARRAFAELRSNSAPEMDRWYLVDLVEVASMLGILPKSVTYLSHALREFRNVVHPGKQLREQITLSADEGRISTEILNACLRAVSAHEQRTRATPASEQPQG